LVESELWAVVAAVPDPELPVVTIEDLGILREVSREPDGGVRVRITPTYSGCPAVESIRTDIASALREAGEEVASVEVVLAPAWTTDAITSRGRRRLEEHGIAPPHPPPAGGPVPLTLSLRCPQCGSTDTEELSRFGSTACKSLWVCSACREPFDHFKTLT
jgi:ring-1,2-phenylacetyl-CoA epoxidase subunit PaaD